MNERNEQGSVYEMLMRATYEGPEGAELKALEERAQVLRAKRKKEVARMFAKAWNGAMKDGAK